MLMLRQGSPFHLVLDSPWNGTHVQRESPYFDEHNLNNPSQA